MAFLRINILGCLAFILWCRFVLGFATFARDCMEAHNKLRVKHGSYRLEIDHRIQKVAQAYAKKLANEIYHLAHSGSEYGENLLMLSGEIVNAEKVVRYWYNEIKKYNFEKPESNKEETSHFTQVIWKDSSRIGCAYFRNGDTAFVVANYDPPGNVAGEFEDNVLPVSSGNSIQSFLPIIVSIFSTFICFFLC